MVLASSAPAWGIQDVNYVFPVLHHPLLLSYLYSFWQIKLALSFQSLFSRKKSTTSAKKELAMIGVLDMLSASAPLYPRGPLPRKKPGRPPRMWFGALRMRHLFFSFSLFFSFNPRRGGKSAALLPCCLLRGRSIARGGCKDPYFTGGRC